MAAPSTLTITFANPPGSPQTISIRAGEDYNASVRNIFLSGGFWFTSSTGVLTFCPWTQISGITTQ